LVREAVTIGVQVSQEGPPPELEGQHVDKAVTIQVGQKVRGVIQEGVQAQLHLVSIPEQVTVRVWVQRIALPERIRAEVFIDISEAVAIGISSSKGRKSTGHCLLPRVREPVSIGVNPLINTDVWVREWPKLQVEVKARAAAARPCKTQRRRRRQSPVQSPEHWVHISCEVADTRQCGALHETMRCLECPAPNHGLG